MFPSISSSLRKFALIAGVLMFPAASQANPLDNLEAFYRTVNSFTGEFSQVVTDHDGVAIDESSGTVMIDRPNRFYWHYADPFPQEIVSDGGTVWLYDHDLAQVTVRPIQEALQGTPVALLSGVDLEREFVIHPGVQDRYDWVDLYPIADDTDFERIRIAFQGATPAVMELYDQFEQTTRIEFRRTVVNGRVDERKFRFDPPPGVEVVGASGQ